MSIVLSQSLNPDSFTARNFMFVPIERVTDPPHTRPPLPPSGPLRGLIILSGVALISFLAPTDDWFRDRVTLDLNEDLGNAVARAPYQAGPGFSFNFSIEQFVPFATVSSRWHWGAPPQKPHWSDGTAVDAFSLDPALGATLQIDIAVRDLESEIYRLGYHLSLFGSLLEQPIVVLE